MFYRRRQTTECAEDAARYIELVMTDGTKVFNKWVLMLRIASSQQNLMFTAHRNGIKESINHKVQ